MNSTDEIAFSLPAAEVNEVLACIRRSIAWQTLIMGKLVAQAEQTQTEQPAANGEDYPATPPPAERPRSRRAIL